MKHAPHPAFKAAAAGPDVRARLAIKQLQRLRMHIGRIGSLLLLCLTACNVAAPAVSQNGGVQPDIAAAASRGAGPRAATGNIIVTTTNGPNPSNEAEVARHEQLLTAFEQLRPDVDVIARPEGFDKAAFAAKFAAGTMEDAYLVPFTEPQDLIANGYAADITDLMKGWDNFYSFNPDVLKIVQNNEGRIFGVPVGGYALGLIYNRKLFAEAGLDPDKPPTTWAEVREYAKRLTDPGKQRAGFAELSKNNQGGWHFTAWAYSFGSDLQVNDGRRWRATFNDSAGTLALQTLKDMRWIDRSIVEQQPLAVDDVLTLLAQERVAMAIMAPDALPTLKTLHDAAIEDFGMAPLPQHGGNATLIGGASWIFNPKASPDVIKAAFEWTINRDFNLTAFEADLKGQQARGELVGWPQFPLFGGDFQRQRDEITAKYMNAPMQNYRPYLESRLQLRSEPPIETQQMYALLDQAMLAVLTDPSADPRTLLDRLANEFQSTALDQIQP